MIYSQRVSSEDARLARVEQQLVDLSKQVEAARQELGEKIDGGPNVSWERSVRGRLHVLEGDAHASKAANTALAEAQRERRLAVEARKTTRRDRWKMRVQVVGVLVAAVAVALPWVERAWS